MNNEDLTPSPPLRLTMNTYTHLGMADNAGAVAALRAF